MFTHSAITLPEVNGFGWNLGNSEYIVWSWPDRFWARSTQKQEQETLRTFCFLSGKQRTNLPICGQPIFTKFAHKTCFCEAVNPFGNIFWKFALKGSFSKKTLIILNDFRLQAAISRKWLQIWEHDDSWRAYGMLAFHPYCWNQLKVIRLASRLRTRKDFPMRRFAMIYILKTPSNNAPNEW